MKSIIVAIVLVFLINHIHGSDIVTLSNSQVYEGKVTKIKHCQVTFKSDGGKYIIPASDIFSIEFENKSDKIYSGYLKEMEQNPQTCVDARLDAYQYHGKKTGHIALGFLFGPFAMLGTALSNPTPEKGVLTSKMSENMDLFSDPDYLNCYKKKAKGRLIGAESIGMGISILMILLITPTYLAGQK